MTMKLSEESRVRASKQRLSPGATDNEIASAFVYGAGNLYQDSVAVTSLEAIIAQVRGDERRKIGTEMSHEANRIFNKQTQDYPSNTLDRVSNYLRIGEPMNLDIPTKKST
jgi:hypothetical protein